MMGCCLGVGSHKKIVWVKASSKLEMCRNIGIKKIMSMSTNSADKNTHKRDITLVVVFFLQKLTLLSRKPVAVCHFGDLT